MSSYLKLSLFHHLLWLPGHFAVSCHIISSLFNKKKFEIHALELLPLHQVCKRKHTIHNNTIHSLADFMLLADFIQMSMDVIKFIHFSHVWYMFHLELQMHTFYIVSNIKTEAKLRTRILICWLLLETKWNTLHETKWTPGDTRKKWNLLVLQNYWL